MLGGSRKYYVSFDNVKVGTLIGQGMVSCLSAWKVAKPTLAVMVGSPDGQQRHAVRPGLQRRAASRCSRRAPTRWWPIRPAHGTRRRRRPSSSRRTPPTRINAVLVPNDENAAPIIIVPEDTGHPGQEVPGDRSGRHAGRHPEHHLGIPVRHGLQADLPRGPGRRGAGPVPAGRQDTAGGSGERHGQGHHVERRCAFGRCWTPSGSPRPPWSPRSIDDGFVPASQLCAGAYAADCTTYGIN